jgi:hypothetical protein
MHRAQHPTPGLEGIPCADSAKQLHTQLKGGEVLGNVKVTDAETISETIWGLRSRGPPHQECALEFC